MCAPAVSLSIALNVVQLPLGPHSNAVFSCLSYLHGSRFECVTFNLMCDGGSFLPLEVRHLELGGVPDFHIFIVFLRWIMMSGWTVGDISFQKMYVCEDVLLSLCCWKAIWQSWVLPFFIHFSGSIERGALRLSMRGLCFPCPLHPWRCPPFSFRSLFPQRGGEVFFFAAQVDPAWEGLDSLSSVRAPILSLHCIRIRFLAIIKS